MSNENPVEMSDEERDEFLGNSGTGVISLDTTDGTPPHSVPISYGYDASASTFYFRIAAGSDSEKRDLPGRAVTFVAYGQSDDRWRSVVAQGSLESTTEESIAAETLEGLARTHIPIVDIFGRSPRTVAFEFYRLNPERITGRKEASSAV
jgi:nitroimidazol reductase NimA-like FMN-containing flavoprotein (pyridoxamine 5'-phosphate oxidase superfamily)